MSLDFKLRYDQLRENDPTKSESTATNEGSTFYDGPSHARNLCLVWPDGKRQFLNYAYLVGGELNTNGELNVITLNFSAYIITLKGHVLASLFTALLDWLPRYIVQVDARYTTINTVDEQEHVITEIIVQSVK